MTIGIMEIKVKIKWEKLRQHIWNLNKIYTLPGKLTYQKLPQEETEIPNSPITTKDMSQKCELFPEKEPQA